MTDAAPRLLLIETSTGRAGAVALAEGQTIRGERRLDEPRRQARDLAPAVRTLLDTCGWKPRDIRAVAVSRGPGSYTGLRVGVMSAKAFAFATGCAILGLDTFAVIAGQAPVAVECLDVLADAQQDRVYVQPFGRSAQTWQPLQPLAIRRFADWLAERDPTAWVSGPGLFRWGPQLPADVPRLDEALWSPGVAILVQLALARYQAGERDDLWALEPLYLRPSSAEQQWRALGRT